VPRGFQRIGRSQVSTGAGAWSTSPVRARTGSGEARRWPRRPLQP